ncbi:hypothetical protein B0T10DRAFT_605056 [Thelonectria olida]|uniref:Rhodopsin domain-containing protein n=1 Tax=Thelonectria olida TaxID=1576542 RepID=A0A9P8W772_9HYPO|nr:hypothetical protein B0T10DRAFT_605056 [Thelonectria olida]
MRHDFAVALANGVYERATSDVPYPYSRLQHIGFFILFFFPAMALAVCILRLYGRFSSKQYGWDDALISLAMVMSIIETGLSWKSMRAGFVGVHIKDIPQPFDAVSAQKWGFIIQLLYYPMLAIVKTSVLLFLMRLGGQKKSVRGIVIGLIGFNLATMVGIVIACILQCTPINYFWLRNSTVPAEGSCVDTTAFYIATSSMTILTDVLVLILPFWIFVGLNLPLRVRTAIIGVFALGAIVTAISILRLVWIIQVVYYADTTSPDYDPTYDIRFTYSAVETNLAIITASAPALRPLFLKWFPSLSSAHKSSGNKYTKDQYGRSTTTKHSRNGTGPLSSHRHSNAFPLTDTKGRSEIRSHSPTNSEEEIMTYNGILKTSEVDVHHGDRLARDVERGGNGGFGPGPGPPESSSSRRQWDYGS